jgi:hypothetical protein
MWLYYRGRALFLLKPAIKHILLILFKEFPSPHKRILLRKIKSAARKSSLFKDHVTNVSAYQWRCYERELNALAGLISNLPRGDIQMDLSAKTHPRNFTGEDREAAMQAFLRDGRKCPGVPAIGRKPHRVVNERLEFDHILPHALGGSNSRLNIRVICEDCNRAKGAHAY